MELFRVKGAKDFLSGLSEKGLAMFVGVKRTAPSPNSTVIGANIAV